MANIYGLTDADLAKLRAWGIELQGQALDQGNKVGPPNYAAILTIECIVSVPPATFSEFSDNRYWLSPADITTTNPASTDDLLLAVTWGIINTTDKFVGTNDAESGTHLLPYGEHVTATIIYDQSINRCPRYFFNKRPIARPLWAEITSSTPIAGFQNRWRYNALAIEFDSQPDIDTPPPVSTLPTRSYLNCWNTVEFANDGIGIEGHGVDIDGPNYANTGFSVQPIRGFPIVQLFGPLPSSIAAPGSNVSEPDSRPYLFTLTNADDGTCLP